MNPLLLKVLGISKKFKIVLAVAVISLLSFHMFNFGYDAGIKDSIQEKQEAISRIIKQYNSILIDQEEVLVGWANKRREKEIKVVEVEKEVIKYVSDTDNFRCFDNDGVLLFNSISRGELLQ